MAVWIGPSVLTGGVFALHSPGPYPLVRYPNIAALLGCHAHRLLVLQVRRPRSCMWSVTMPVYQEASEEALEFQRNDSYLAHRSDYRKCLHHSTFTQN